MGKLLKQQRRGKGSGAYRAPSHRYKANLQYRKYDEVEKTSALRGQILEFIDDPARGALLMNVALQNGERLILLAPEGALIGGHVDLGIQASYTLGGVYPLSRMPDGATVYNIEMQPGDGGKLVRAPGSYATVVSREKDYVYVKLPSRKVLSLPATCRVQFGIVCGGGRLEMPLMKAGANFYKKHAQNRRWPVNRGVKMCSYTHPFGGKQHHKGRSSTVSRGAPPGRKVGHIAARSTGRRKARTDAQ